MKIQWQCSECKTIGVIETDSKDVWFVITEANYQHDQIAGSCPKMVNPPVFPKEKQNEI